MEYKNILIIKMSSLGDILHALPTAVALRQRFPKAKLSWLVHPQFAGFVPDPPLIDEIVYFDKVAFKQLTLAGKWHYLQAKRKELHQKHYDLVIDLQGLFKSAVMAYLTGCPTKLGYAELREGSSLISRPIVGTHAQEHVIERYLDVARYLGAQVESVQFPQFALPVETASVQAKLGEAAQKPYVILLPGARWESKKWPVEHFATLAQLFIQAGYYVVLSGGKEDMPAGARIAELVQHAPQLIDLIGQTSLREVAALIKQCYYFVSADTGPLHLATALQKPLTAMYGPTKPERTGPYGNPAATVLVSPAECAGCLKKQCDHWHCMHDITPAMVWESFQNYREAEHGPGAK